MRSPARKGFLLPPSGCDKPSSSVPALAQERRKYFRAFPRFALTVKVRVQYFSGTQQIELTGTTVDIGLGGLGATLTEPLISKERVWLQFIVPGRETPVRVLSKLRHLDDGRYGFQFLNITAEDREAIRASCEKLPQR
jgi:c-di-GMP-binding flagellar brake protein YcgR